MGWEGIFMETTPQADWNYSKGKILSVAYGLGNAFQIYSFYWSAQIQRRRGGGVLSPIAAVAEIPAGIWNHDEIHKKQTPKRKDAEVWVLNTPSHKDKYVLGNAAISPGRPLYQENGF